MVVFVSGVVVSREVDVSIACNHNGCTVVKENLFRFPKKLLVHIIVATMNGPQQTACLAKGYINSELNVYSEPENMNTENYKGPVSKILN